MGGEHYGAALAGQAIDNIPKPAGRSRVHAPGRLVQQRQRRGACDHRRDGGPLPLARAQVARVAPGQLQQAHLAQDHLRELPATAPAERQLDLGTDRRPVQEHARVLGKIGGPAAPADHPSG